MFGKLLVGIVAALVVGAGGFLYFESQTCPSHIAASCPSSNQSCTVTTTGESESSCCGTASRAAVCCETSDLELASEEVLTVEPREVK